MKTKYITILFILFLTLPFAGWAQDAIKTSFEDYTVGNVNKQNKWTVSKGSATIEENPIYSHTGNKGLSISNTSSLQTDHVAYSSSEDGLAGDVYVDFWIKVNSITTGAFSITGNDLKSNSRSFMLEFSADGKIKVYNKSSGSSKIKPTYAIGEWLRISYKIDNANAVCQFALNGTPYDEVLEFREIKNNSTVFNYHSIRFIQSSGNCDIALDDIYIGTEPISDINFEGTGPIVKPDYVFTITQPQNAEITLSPLPTDGKYKKDTKVTASITINDLCKYKFNKWTGDVSGNSNPVTFTVTKDMNIGAEIVDIPAQGQTRTVKNYNELKTALSSMNPGDIIELEDGTYSGNGLTVTQSGCEERPIIVRAKNIGQAKLTGKLYFTLKNISYVTFEGLNFDLDPVSSIFKMEGCSYVRITRNEFRMKKETEGQTSKWILIGDEWNNLVCNSHHNRIDHNLFDGKYDGGSWVVIDGAHGTTPGDISKHDRIDHNHFRNNTPRVSNEKETIRIGVSDLTPCSAYCTVEYNLFENCDGDPEIVSVKSCDNLVKGNTFRGCLGTVCLRQGSRNTVDGNYFFGDGKIVDGNGCGGIRVYGIDHKIINNYFEGLTGEKWDAACTITNGDVTNPSSSWSSHNIPENVVFAFNTYINNKSDIEIGFTNSDKYSKTPKNCLITNNIYVQPENPIVTIHTAKAASGVTFANNIMHATENGSIGTTLAESQAMQINPLLVLSNCVTDGDNCSNLLPYAAYKLSENSPAIDKATINNAYSILDFEGQIRTGNKDIGADEYNNEIISNGILGEEHVGPYAINFVLELPNSIENGNLIKQIIDIQCYNKELKINYSVENASETLINIYDLNGNLIYSSTSYPQSGLNSLNIQAKDLPTGVCIVNLINKEYNISKKVIIK